MRSLFTRRLERLERSACPGKKQFSVLIQFVHPQKGVTSTLLLGPGGQRVRRNLQPSQKDVTRSEK
jgi:hypothetical protein